jgi:hypothetical protein
MSASTLKWIAYLLLLAIIIVVAVGALTGGA